MNNPVNPSQEQDDTPLNVWSERRFAFAAWVGYVVMLVIVAWSHEPWHDETRAWQLAVTSPGIQAMVSNVRFEGHPLMYFMLLKGIAAVSQSWGAILAVHVGIASATSWIVLRFAPFARHQRLLLVFGYYLAYEFAVFARPYSLGMLLAFGAVAAWCATPRKAWLAGVMLVILANTSVVGLGLSLSLAAGMLVDEYWKESFSVKRMPARHVFKLVAAIFLVVAIVAWQAVPPSTANYRGAGVLGDSGVTLWSLAWILSLPTRATMPFQMMTGDLLHWGSWVFISYGRSLEAVAVVLTVMTTVLWFAVVSRRRSGAVIMVSSLLGYLVLFSTIHDGSFRHHGHLAIAWILAAWMAKSGPAQSLPVPLLRTLSPWANGRSWLLTMGLLPMTLAYLPAAWSELRHPFSDANTVAQILSQPDLDSLPIVGVAQPWSQTVAALSNKAIHFPSGLVSKVEYRLPHSTKSELLTGSLHVETHLLKTHCRVIVISSPSLPYSSPFHTTMLYRTPANSTMAMAGAFVVEVAYAQPSPRCPANY